MAIPTSTYKFYATVSTTYPGYSPALFMANTEIHSMREKVYKYLELKSTFLLSILIFEVRSLTHSVPQNPTTLTVQHTHSFPF